MCFPAVSHLLGGPSVVPGAVRGRARGRAGGGTGTTSPCPPSSTDPAPLSIPFIDSFHKQKLAERRPRLSPAPGLPETGMRGGGRPFASRDRAHPPAARITGASTAQTLCYKATLPKTHRGAPPGRGGTGWDRERGSCPAPPGAERCGGESTGERTGGAVEPTGERRAPQGPGSPGTHREGARGGYRRGAVGTAPGCRGVRSGARRGRTGARRGGTGSGRIAPRSGRDSPGTEGAAGSDPPRTEPFPEKKKRKKKKGG